MSLDPRGFSSPRRYRAYVLGRCISAGLSLLVVGLRRLSLALGGDPYREDAQP